MCEPAYATSIVVVRESSRSIARFHCCTYPEPSARFTPNTPCPNPAVGVRSTGATLGPCINVNAGCTLSNVLCVTVCKNGKNGVVNGVVIPVCSIHTNPYPERTTVFGVTRYATPALGPKSPKCNSRAALGTPFFPAYSNCCVFKLNVAE